VIAPILMTIVALVFSDKFALKWGSGAGGVGRGWRILCFRGLRGWWRDRMGCEPADVLPPLRGWDCEGKVPRADAPGLASFTPPALCFWLAEDEWSENGSRALECLSGVEIFDDGSRAQAGVPVPQRGSGQPVEDFVVGAGEGQGPGVSAAEAEGRGGNGMREKGLSSGRRRLRRRVSRPSRWRPATPWPAKPRAKYMPSILPLCGITSIAKSSVPPQTYSTFVSRN